MGEGETGTSVDRGRLVARSEESRTKFWIGNLGSCRVDEGRRGEEEAGVFGSRGSGVGDGPIVVDGIGGREDESSGKSRQGEINRCA